MTSRAYLDDDLPPDTVRQDRLVTQLAIRLAALEKDVARLTKKVAYLEGAHSV